MFKAKRFEIDVSHEYLVMLNKEDAQNLRLNPRDRVKIVNSKNNNFVVCVLEIIESYERNRMKDVKLKNKEIGIYEKAFDKLNILENDSIDIFPTDKPKSLDYIKKKEKGEKLSKDEFKAIIHDITTNIYSEIETTFFVLACSFRGLSDQEIIYLTQAMIEEGKTLDFDEKIIVDKHCIGGVPNNRTSMIVTPIIAAAGLTIPKSSSRSITSPAGTADTMEVLCNVEVPLSDMYSQVKNLGGCIVWGGALDLSPADDLIIHVEHPLEIDSEGQLIASILSKKKSVGSTHVLIDIPVGPTAKIKTQKKAKALSKKFIKIGKAIGLEIKTIITDGSQPIGSGIGPLYEAYDVLDILSNKPGNATDLREKSLYMAGLILEMAGVVQKNQGYDKARNILQSGRALEKFNDIIEAQGRNKIPNNAKYSEEIKVDKNGIITGIHNIHLSKCAFILGAPQDQSAGIILQKKKNDKVNSGDTLFTIHADSKTKLKYAINYLKEHIIYYVE